MGALIYQKLFDPNFVLMVLSAVAAVATVLTLAMPLLESSDLQKRMNAVAIERDRIRARERERMLAASGRSAGLRQEPKAYMKRIVDRFNLAEHLGTGDAKAKLARAGYRGRQADIAFLFFRAVTPIGLFLVTLFYVFVVIDLDQHWSMKLGIAIAAAYLGIKAPEIFLSNQTKKRQLQIRRAWPDALDLLLICVESGMSIEQAFRKVSEEMASNSVALAEELALTTAELSYLPDRRLAYEHLGERTGLETVKSVMTALVQSERYGTPLGQALRVLSQESRDQRMNEAEKKAAALPPKLTVPMIVFFLPVLFVVIMTPAIIQVMKLK